MTKTTRKELISVLTSAAEKIVSKDEAEYFAYETLEAHIRKSPRTNPLKDVINDLEACFRSEDKGLTYNTDLPSFFSIDFHGQGPLVYIKRIHDELEKRANTNGLAMVAFTNSQSMHDLHTWVQGLAKRGLLAIAVCNGGPGAVIPFNGTKGLFGANPIAYGLPGVNGQIHCVDMASSEIPFFEIMNAHKNNIPLRTHVAVDSNGEYTTDADKALDLATSKDDPVSNIVPMGGGYKGYYMVYLMEVLSSALIGMPASTQMSNDFIPEEHGAIIMVFSPQAMGTEQQFKDSINSLHSALKAQKPKAGTNIRVPGEENNKKFANASDILELDVAFLDKLNKLG